MKEYDNNNRKIEIGLSTPFDLLEIPEERSREMAKDYMNFYSDTQRFETRLFLTCGTLFGCGVGTAAIYIINNFDKIEAHLENMFK
jgi:hypothetical protein